MYQQILFGIFMLMLATLKTPPLLIKAVKLPYRDEFNDYNKQCNCVCGPKKLKLARIVGGAVSKPHEFPWLAAIFLNGRLFCAGSLITQRHVLTAAHCLNVRNVRALEVVLGVHSFREMEGELHHVVRGVQHQGFKLYEHDIGILVLEKTVQFTDNIRPACLPVNVDGDYAGLLGIVAGWGNMGEAAPKSDTVLRVDVPVIQNSECISSSYSASEVSDNMLCAGYPEGGKDACQGDSGGPFHVYNNKGILIVIGIVSFGRGCARPNTPGVYTKVSHYLDWIRNNVDNSCLCSQPSNQHWYMDGYH
ncbi:venom protease-like [Periplaneta americana]|uniref:venom protease-like n=1 Tax=Periplaneta americana TaxID=6978 RepID=UPI0037E903E3